MHVLQTKTKLNQLPFFFFFGQVPRAHAEQTVLRVTWDLKESKVRQVCLDSAAYPVFRTVFAHSESYLEYYLDEIDILPVYSISCLTIRAKSGMKFREIDESHLTSLDSIH